MGIMARRRQAEEVKKQVEAKAEAVQKSVQPKPVEEKEDKSNGSKRTRAS